MQEQPLATVPSEETFRKFAKTSGCEQTIVDLNALCQPSTLLFVLARSTVEIQFTRLLIGVGQQSYVRILVKSGNTLPMYYVFPKYLAISDNSPECSLQYLKQSVSRFGKSQTSKHLILLAKSLSIS